MMACAVLSLIATALVPILQRGKTPAATSGALGLYVH